MLIRYEKNTSISFGGTQWASFTVVDAITVGPKKNGEKSGSNTHKLHSQNMKGKKRHIISNIIEYFQLYSFNK